MKPLLPHASAAPPARSPRSAQGGAAAQALTRGVCRLFEEMGAGTVTEFPLPNGRRVDVMALDADGSFTIVEVKSSVADFRADRKWPEYLPFCERFYFAVPEDFPLPLVPDACGLIVADRFGAAIRRPPETGAVNGNRKRRQLLRFALIASERLQRIRDPRG
jgi:hypothetical protein